MNLTQLNPYLFFDGNADQAIKLYQEALGARVEGLQRYGDMPGGDKASPDANRVLHALLHLGQAGMVMLSDRQPGKPPASGSISVGLALRFEKLEEMTRAFDLLAQGGEVQMAIHDAFWGDKFGALKDRFGIHWMLSTPQRQP